MAFSPCRTHTVQPRFGSSGLRQALRAPGPSLAAHSPSPAASPGGAPSPFPGSPLVAGDRLPGGPLPLPLPSSSSETRPLRGPPPQRPPLRGPPPQRPPPQRPSSAPPSQRPSSETLLSSVQFSLSDSFRTTPWTAARQASLSITNSQSLLKLMSIE